MKNLDIVFVIDSTAGSQEIIKSVSKTVSMFNTDLQNIDFNNLYCLVEFKDCLAGDKIIVHKFGTEYFTIDIKQLEKKLNSITAKGNKGKFISSFDSISEATKLKFREDTNRIIVLITDTPPNIPDKQIKSLPDLFTNLKNGEINQIYIITDVQNPENKIYIEFTNHLQKRGIESLIFDVGSHKDFQKIFRGVTKSIQNKSKECKIEQNFSEKFAKSIVAKELIKQVEKELKEEKKNEFQLEKLVVYVTSANYDNIGQVLDSLKIPHKPFANNYKCDFLFLNCGSSDYIDENQLKDFVLKGGILYASDWASDVIQRAFPEHFNFEGNIGESETVIAEVVDYELKNVIGKTIEIFFDLGSWSVLNSIKKGNIILKSTETGYPLMVMLEIGKGKVFYTCFHNHAQVNEKEQILLQLLVLKQISQYKSTTIDAVSKQMKIDLNQYKKVFK